MEDAEGTNGRRPKFSAFLSYSHADASAVRKLHSQLESYRLPKELGEVGALNEMSGRLGRVFRDREDLSAAENLSDAVTAALDQSEVLVVVCSPEAKASKWVGQEIAYFREHRPGKPILAAIVCGEPEEAFPDALTEGGAEPLAADLRREGDGWKLGFLKVVSGIAGVPLDALVQRDSQRQTRRVMAITGVSVLAALVMAIMTTVAIQSRNEAQFQQAEAEGLVAYMMDDLRTELKGVGRLDVMEGVNDRALTYYTNQGDLSGLSPESLEKRATILHAMGEDELNSVDADSELIAAYFREAFRTTEANLEQEPANADRMFAHGQSEYWLGYNAYVENSWQEAGEWWSRYLSSAQKLTQIEGDTDRSSRELVYAEGNLCTLGFDAPSEVPDTTLGHCKKALELLRASIGQRPVTDKDAEDLVNRLNWFAYALEKSDASNASGEQYLQAEKIVEELIERDPKNLDLKDIWLTIQIAIARIEGQGTAAAQSRLQKAADEARRIVSADPRNTNWSSRLESIKKMTNTEN